MKKIKTEKQFIYKTNELEQILKKNYGYNVFLQEIEVKNKKVYFSILLENETIKKISYSFSELEQLMKIHYGNNSYNIRQITVIDRTKLHIDTIKNSTSIWKSEHSLIIKQLINKIQVIINDKSRTENLRFMIGRMSEWNEYTSYRSKLNLEIKKNLKSQRDSTIKNHKLQKEYEQLQLLISLNKLVKSSKKNIQNITYYNNLKSDETQTLIKKIENIINNKQLK
ncbi:hypothetical protein XF24_00971 [candidate division SR1 bacterium Aalborg_AAW-1]|nr:hypothetical protein XF24_00971 [candidate division SR1 bacterium Aalborg_AAW-1]